VSRNFVMDYYICSRVMAVYKYIHYYRYILCMYDICMFIRYLVSITQVLKDTLFGLDNWCQCGDLFIFINSTYIHTYHFISEGVAEASQISLRDVHILPKLFSCE
jgi:hypothetical protein